MSTSPVSLESHRLDAFARRAEDGMKVRVERAVGLETHDVPARLAADLAEKASDEKLPIRLDDDGGDHCVEGRGEACIERPIGVEARHTILRLSVHRAERSADQQPAVRELAHGHDGAVHGPDERGRASRRP